MALVLIPDTHNDDPPVETCFHRCTCLRDHSFAEQPKKDELCLKRAVQASEPQSANIHDECVQQ